MKRVLFIAFYFPPRNNIACYRSGCFAKFLPRHGWTPTVIAQDWPSDRLDSDPDFVGAFPEGMEICRVPAPPERGFYQRVVLRKLAPYFWPRYAPILWWRQARARVRSLLESTRFDAVWATSDPLTPLALAQEAAKSSRLPWLADIRDCLNVQPFGSWYKRPFFRRAERHLCRAADRVVTVSKGLAKALETITETPVTIIPNGFDPSLLPDEALPPLPIFTILYAGTLVVGRQDPRPVFRGLQLCLERGLIPSAEVEILFLGTKRESVNLALADFPEKLPVRVLPRLPHRAALALQTRASALLLLASPFEEGVMTGKVFDYLAAKRPILAVPDDTHTTGALLRSTGAGVALSDSEAIARRLAEWYGRWRNDRSFNLERNETEISRYSRFTQTGELAGLLARMCQDHRAKSR